jgi:hypothetical protein
MQVEVGRKREGYIATPSPFMVAKGHPEAPPFLLLQQGMVTKRGDATGGSEGSSLSLSLIYSWNVELADI